MKKILTKIVRRIRGKNYIHIPKWFWLRDILKKVLDVERVRGRGRNWKAIHKKEAELIIENPDYKLGRFTRSLGYDGSIPLKYASYLYLKLKG